jgi:hypothetical protein
VLQSNVIKGNRFSMDSGDGILVVTPATGGCGTVVTGNTITGSGTHGIEVNAHGAPEAGGVVVSGNRVTGFKKSVTIR